MQKLPLLPSINVYFVFILQKIEEKWPISEEIRIALKITADWNPPVFCSCRLPSYLAELKRKAKCWTLSYSLLRIQSICVLVHLVDEIHENRTTLNDRYIGRYITSPDFTSAL